MRKAIVALMLCCAVGLVGSARARHQVELESTYLGDGWFRYQLRSVDDPFFLFFDLGHLSVVFPGHTEFGPVPAGWMGQFTNSAAGPYITWSFTNCDYVACQTRPYEAIFLARSEQQHFKRAHDALFTMSFSMRGGYHGNLSTVNTVGYARIHALVPCPPEEADSSPTNLVERFTVIQLPDVQIDSLTRVSNEVIGLTFTYSEDSTVQLQATRNFQNWTNVTFLYGNSGTTTWTSGGPLNAYGDFFRLLLAAEGHVPIPSNTSAGTASKMARATQPDAAAIPTKSDGRVLFCVPGTSGIEVQVLTSLNTRYELKLVSSTGETLRRRIVEGTGGTVRSFISGPVPNPVLVTIERLE